jgi:hypothetical protein
MPRTMSPPSAPETPLSPSARMVTVETVKRLGCGTG